MNSPENIDYEQIEEILAETECETSAAELQAILCGMLAAGIPLNDKSWFKTVNDIANDGREISSLAESKIRELFVWTHQQMNELDSLSILLLPDDSYPSVDQLEAIADWCQGFLLGFGLQMGNKDISNPEVKESLADLAEISHIELDAEENEETQAALITLIEHLKVAVKLIYWEIVLKNMLKVDDEDSENKTIH